MVLGVARVWYGVVMLRMMAPERSSGKIRSGSGRRRLGNQSMPSVAKLDTSPSSGPEETTSVTPDPWTGARFDNLSIPSDLTLLKEPF